MKSAKSRKTPPQARLLRFDRRLLLQRNLGWGQLAGLDEVGRGPLAGPLVASAVILHKPCLGVAIDDSKKLSPQARETAYRAILPCADIGIGYCPPHEIDRVGIHKAMGLAMVRALRRLPVSPELVLIDGPWRPADCPFPSLPIIDGDALSFHVACASIVAKVIRDRMMVRVHQLHPEYGFLNHKGYGTPEHLAALREIGGSCFHRYSFRPVREPDLFEEFIG